MTAHFLLGVAMAALLAAVPAAAETIAITNARVATLGPAGIVEDGTVVIRGERIESVAGGGAVPNDARVVDAAGRWVTPGIFNPFSQLGLVEVVAFANANDSKAESSVYSAGIEVRFGLNPRVSSIAAARAAGITRSAAFPATSSRIFGGYGALVEMSGGDEILFKPRALQWVELGNAGVRNGGGSRGAVWTQLLDAFYQAQTDGACTNGPECTWTRVDLDAFRLVLAGHVPLVVHVERVADIRNVLALRDRYPKLKLVLAGASEGWMMAEDIARAGVPVIVSAFNSVPYSFEMLAATRENAARLDRAGVLVAISPDRTPSIPMIGKIRQAAGVAVAHGMPWEAGLQAIMLNPARIYGMEEQLGSIEEGKLADLVIWDGDPLELSTDPVAVFVNGREVSLTTRQTELRDRYLGR